MKPGEIMRPKPGDLMRVTKNEIAFKSLDIIEPGFINLSRGDTVLVIAYDPEKWRFFNAREDGSRDWRDEAVIVLTHRCGVVFTLRECLALVRP
jgi:hypothetical protein